MEVIKMSAEKDYYIVCQNRKECSRIFHIAQELGLNMPFPVSFDEFLEKRYCGRHIKGFIIDNADMLLQYLAQAPIKCITLTKEVD